MWTSKRVLIMLGTLILFALGFLVYAFFLGNIDGLPPLPEVYGRDAVPIPEGPSEATGSTTEEKLVSVDDWQKDLESGSLREVFACGTAAVITPIGNVKFDGGAFAISGAESSPVATAIRERLLSIQHGLTPDTHGWMHRVS